MKESEPQSDEDVDGDEDEDGDGDGDGDGGAISTGECSRDPTDAQFEGFEVAPALRSTETGPKKFVGEGCVTQLFYVVKEFQGRIHT